METPEQKVQRVSAQIQEILEKEGMGLQAINQPVVQLFIVPPQKSPLEIVGDKIITP